MTDVTGTLYFTVTRTRACTVHMGRPVPSVAPRVKTVTRPTRQARRSRSMHVLRPRPKYDAMRIETRIPGPEGSNG